MADRTPDYISRWLEQNLYRFDNPSQYLPGHRAGGSPQTVGQCGCQLAGCSQLAVFSRGRQPVRPGGVRHD